LAGVAQPQVTLMTAAYDTATLGAYSSGTILHDAANYGTGFNIRGNATQIVKGGTWTTVTALDIYGQPTSISGPGGVATFERRADSNFAATTGSTHNGVRVTATWDGMLRLSSSTGAANETTVYGWDVADRPTSKTLPDGTRVEISYSFSPPLTKEVVRKNVGPKMAAIQPWA
jgi:YD repeat-containing protein